MEFDKSKVFTALNAGEVKVGSKGYFADNIAELQRCVFTEDKDYFCTITGIMPESESYRFLADVCNNKEVSWLLFYFVEEPKEKKFHSYKDTDEMIEDFCGHFNLIPQDHRLPTLWVKFKTDVARKYLIIRLTQDTVTLCLESDILTLSLDVLAEKYTYLDGSPCGIEED